MLATGGSRNAVAAGTEGELLAGSTVRASILKRPSPRFARVVILAATLALAGDTVYRTVARIGYLNREECILYRALPGMGFLIFEHLVETGLIALVGTFVAILLARQLHRFPRLFPARPIAAFLYGAALPLCSCAAVPLLYAMRGKRDERTTLAFVLAAPLLSPSIIVLSFALMGTAYGVLRIAASFVLVMATAHVVPLVMKRRAGRAEPSACASYADVQGPACTGSCAPARGDVYLETLAVFRSILPYLLLAGTLSIAFDLLKPERWLEAGSLPGGGLGSTLGGALVVLVGIPLYLCHGTEVLLLRPLVHHGVSLGTAVGFSLTSTGVCLTSLAMLGRFLGRRATIVLAGSVLFTALALGFAIDRLVAF